MAFNKSNLNLFTHGSASSIKLRFSCRGAGVNLKEIQINGFTGSHLLIRPGILRWWKSGLLGTYSLCYQY